MKNFLVRYYGPEGCALIKNIQAERSSDVRIRLTSEGYLPSFVVPNIFLNIFHPIKNAGMKDKELAAFFIELYQLAQSVGSIGKAFYYINKNKKEGKESKTNKKLKEKFIYLVKWLYNDHKRAKIKNRRKFVEDCTVMLERGYTLGEIFKVHYFEELVLSLVDLAASTGNYPEVFLKISEFFDAKDLYRKNVVGTMAYPAFLFFLLFTAFTVFLYYIIPTFASFFSQFSRIPSSTEYVIWLFTYIKSIFIYIIVLAVSIFTIIILDLFEIKSRLLTLFLDIPTIRNIFNYNYLSWFFYRFSLMISSGLTITVMFDYFRNNTEKRYFKYKFDLAYNSLMSGFTLRDSLDNADFLSEDVIESIGYGEIGGFLPDTILRLSKDFKEKSSYTMHLFTKTLFFLVMASVVFFLLLMFFSLFLPLIQGMVSLPGNY